MMRSFHHQGLAFYGDIALIVICGDEAGQGDGSVRAQHCSNFEMPKHS